MLALDTETTGLWLHHGCQPFFISTCDHTGDISHQWEFDVDHFTREVLIPDGEAARISQILADCCRHSWRRKIDKNGRSVDDRYDSGIVLHNAKFDLHALKSIGVTIPPWRFIDCTLTASHALDSAEPHGLKDLSIKYLQIPDDDERTLERVVNKARRIAKKLGWATCEPGHPHFRSANGKLKKKWKMDLWIPRQLAEYDIQQERKFVSQPIPSNSKSSSKSILSKPRKWTQYKPLLTPQERIEWKTVCRRYAIHDAERTMLLWQMYDVVLDEDRTTNFRKQYLFRRATLSTLFRMERRGATVSLKEINRRIKSYGEVVSAKYSRALKIAILASGNESFNIKSPVQVKKLLFQTWKLPVVLKTTKGNPSAGIDGLMKLRFGHLVNPKLYGDPDRMVFSCTAEPSSIKQMRQNAAKLRAGKVLSLEDVNPLAAEFIDCILVAGKINKALEFMVKYKACALPTGHRDYGRMHPKYNLTGREDQSMATTRLSSNDPNATNVSKGDKSDILEYELPPDADHPDGHKIYLDDHFPELAAADLSGRGVFGPAPGRCWYAIDFNQLQLRIFAYISQEPDLIKAFQDGWDAHDYMAHRRFGIPKGTDPTKFQRREAKVINFKFIFGGSFKHTPELNKMLNEMFPNAVAFIKEKSEEARRDGFILTPGGYKLMVEQTHKAVNYIDQGCEGEMVQRAMNSTERFLQQSKQAVRETDAAFHQLVRSASKTHLILQIHDELVFDAPLPPKIQNCIQTIEVKDKPKQVIHIQHLPVVAELCRLMEAAGDYYGMHTPVEPELILSRWDQGIKIVRGD